MDLNDLRYFTLIVDSGGFSAASRLSHISKSRLSRRVALLEERLGVRLLQRSTRRLALTEAGRIFHEHCAAMMVEADAAQQAIEQLRSEPAGTVRMTCPTVMAQLYVAGLLAEFTARHPKVSVVLDSNDRVVNLLEERIDIALRARDGGLAVPGLTARRVGSGRMILVASPGYLARRGPLDSLEQLSLHDTIGSTREGGEQAWSLTSASGHKQRFAHNPRLMCSDFIAQLEAALHGAGVAMLPLRSTGRALQAGTLVHVLRDWGTPEEDVHLVFATRRGMLPAVRALLDFLVERLPAALLAV